MRPRVSIGLLSAVALSCGGDDGTNVYEAGDANGMCEDTCRYAHDGECDDGGPGAVFSVCDLGTDCDDCGWRSGGGDQGDGASTVCGDSCQWAFDGECDDGAGGSVTSLCTFGTDCGDCGTRTGGAGDADADGDGGDGGDDGGGYTNPECDSDGDCGSCERCSEHTCRYCGKGPYGCFC